MGAPAEGGAPGTGGGGAPESTPAGAPARKAEVTYAYVGALMDELARGGVRHACLCPGSRSTPLALVAARHPELRVWVHLDERSAAFFALGLAKAAGEPVALIATSGTAPANFYPAVIEARYARVPLVLLTADRPHELRDFGAPQTVDQMHLFGWHVKWFVDLALPEADPGMLRYARQVAARAVAVATAAPAGPVHLNVPLREPLVPPEALAPVGASDGSASRAGTEPRLEGGARPEAGARAGDAPNGDARDRDALKGDAHDRDALNGDAARAAGAAITPAVPPTTSTTVPPVAPAGAVPAGAAPGAAVPAGIHTVTGSRVLSPRQAADLAAALSAARRGLIVCGPATDPGLAGAVTRLAGLLDYPVLADPLSGVRCGPHDRSPVIDAYDAFLREPRLAEALEPDLVLRLGAVPTSKPLLLYLERHAGARQILLDEEGWNDPAHVATEVVAADPRLACEALAGQLAAAGLAGGGTGPVPGPGGPRAPEPARNGARALPDAAAASAGAGAGGTGPAGAGLSGAGRGGAVPGGADAGGTGAGARGHEGSAPGPAGAGAGGRPGPAAGSTGTAWLDLWRRINATARRAMVAELGSSEEPFEGRVFSELAELLPDGATLFAGNSMPVRDLDTFFPAVPKRIRFLANRGANGIDGVVSSALGAAAAGQGPLVLVIGDLSFYHDLNGLLAASRFGIDATIVLINNDGGGIFSFLPQARLPEHFELLFGTPHGLDFRHAAALYGAAYERPEDWASFREAVRRAMAAPGLSIVEVRTNRQRNVERHRRVWRAVAAALEAEGLLAAASDLGAGRMVETARREAR